MKYICKGVNNENNFTNSQRVSLGDYWSLSQIFRTDLKIQTILLRHNLIKFCSNTFFLQCPQRGEVRSRSDQVRHPGPEWPDSSSPPTRHLQSLNTPVYGGRRLMDQLYFSNSFLKPLKSSKRVKSLCDCSDTEELHMVQWWRGGERRGTQGSHAHAADHYTT